MDKKPAISPAFSSRGLFQLVVLALCAFTLVTHFVTENLEFSNPPAVFESSKVSGYAHIDQDGCEDNFILPLTVSLPSEHMPFPHNCVKTARPAFSPIAVLVPPPNS